MAQFTLLIPRDKTIDFHDDLTAWASDTGYDPHRPVSGGDPFQTTNAASPVQYLIEVNESFFEQFPDWRACIK